MGLILFLFGMYIFFILLGWVGEGLGLILGLISLIFWPPGRKKKNQQ